MSLSAYTASCVRACALRGGMLRPPEWHLLQAADTPAAALAWLQNRGVLAADVSDVAAAERAAHEAVIRNGGALARFAHGELRDLLCCFVHYYDLLNVGSLIRRIHFDAPGDVSGPRFYDTGVFGLFRPHSLESITNFAALARLLRRSNLAAPYNAALLRYRDDGDVSRLIERIEVAFFAAWCAAAERCGFDPRQAPVKSALAIFLVAHVIEAAARLATYRGAETSRIADWLQLAARGPKLQVCLDALEDRDRVSAAISLTRILLPDGAAPADQPEDGAAPDYSVRLRSLIVSRALKATRGVAFNADFLTGFLIMQVSQARELTMLLESKDAGVASFGSSFAEVRQ